MNKNLYLIVFIGFLAISFFTYINQNQLIILVNKIVPKSIVLRDTTQPITKEDLLGKYKTKGKSRYTMLDIYKDTFTLSFYRHFATTEYSGKWIYENNSLILNYLYIDEDRIDTDTSYMVNREYKLVRQDSFLFCVPNYGEKELSQEYEKICNLYNNGANFNEEYGETYIMRRKLYNYLPISVPTVPEEYQQKLLKKPIICQVITIENDTIITVNVGKKDGVFEKLILVKRFSIEKLKKRDEYFYEKIEDFVEVEFIKCNNATSKARIIYKPYFWNEDYQKFLLNIKKLKVGDTLHSYYEK